MSVVTSLVGSLVDRSFKFYATEYNLCRTAFNYIKRRPIVLVYEDVECLLEQRSRK